MTLSTLADDGNPAGARRHKGTAAVAALVLLFAFAPFVLGQFKLELVGLALLYGLFAFGLDMAWGRAGIVTIGQAVFFGLGAYGVGIAVNSGVWVGWGALTALGVAAIVAAGIAAAGVRDVCGPSTMAVLTLATTLLAEKIALSWVSVTGGSNGLFVMPPTNSRVYYWSILAFIVVVVFLVKTFLLDRALGNRLTAIRLNDVRARHLGIPTYRVRVLAFVIGAVIAAMAGALAAPLMSTVTPDRVGIILSTQALVWVALGGRGTLLGPFVGAMLVVYGQDALAGTIGNFYLLLLGILFVLSVLFFPHGIVGLFDHAQRIVGVSTARGEGKPEAAPPGAALAVPLLATDNLTIRLGGNVIIDELDFTMDPAEILCVIGPNGAGKSTFLNALSGALPAASGSITFAGEDITSVSAERRAVQGLARTFQVPSLFPELTVGEHMALARQEGSGGSFQSARYVQMEREQQDVHIEKLSLGDRRLLEIAMALALRPKVLLLDEPAAGLARHEAELLVRDLKEMREKTGCSIVCVEHDMELVRLLADRVICLYQGQVLSQGSMDEVSADENVRNSYLGRT